MTNRRSAERSPAVQFYFRQFSGDEHVMAMDTAAVGAHILLMCAAGASKFQYKLPADDGVLRGLSHNPPMKVWDSIKTQLLRGAWKLSLDAKWWIQDGLRRSFLKQKAYSKEQSRKGKMSAAARRFNSGSTTVKSGCASVTTGPPTEINPSSSSSSSSASASASQKKEQRAVAPLFVLPDWIPKEVWDEYEKMRRSISKPMTHRARVLAVGTLERLKADGYTPTAVLDNSILNSHQGLFAPRGNSHGANWQGAKPNGVSNSDARRERTQQALEAAGLGRSRLADALHANVPAAGNDA